MSELYDRIISQRGSLENLVMRIPGFQGYMDKAARRDADRMLRDYLAQMLGQRLDRYVRIEKMLLDKGGLSHMSRTSSVKSRLQTYRDRVKAATLGYSGLMDAVKIGDIELELLYAFDELQVRYLDRLDEALNTFEQAAQNGEGIDAALNNLDALLVEANEAFGLRDETIRRFNETLTE